MNPTPEQPTGPQGNPVAQITVVLFDTGDFRVSGTMSQTPGGPATVLPTALCNLALDKAKLALANMEFKPATNCSIQLAPPGTQVARNDKGV